LLYLATPSGDGDTEDIFSGMSSWTLDADEIKFQDKIGEGSAAKGKPTSLSCHLLFFPSFSFFLFFFLFFNFYFLFIIF
jgi:hypothetical protein